MAEENEGVLDQFLNEWKEELREKRVQDAAVTDEAVDLNSDIWEPPRKQYCQSSSDVVEIIKEKDCSHQECVSSFAVIGGPSLFVLPEGGILSDNIRTTDVKYNNSISALNTTDKTGTVSDNLVDRLIIDLDETNTVPFFDIQLPRELALLIFNYLSVVDLCHCAQVSHSWRTLAEDNLIWIAVCKRMGYRAESVEDQLIHWKTVVKELILHRKQVQQNWMERMCTVTVHKPNSVIGSLCSATYHNGEVLACYSSGVCHLWSLSTKESVIVPPTKAVPTCSAVCNQLGCHCDANGTCILFKLEDNEAKYTHKLTNKIHLVSMATNSSHYAVALASGGNNPFSSLILLVNEDSALKDWYKTTVQLPIPALLNNFQVNKVSLVPTIIESDPFQLLYSTQSHLVLQSPLQSFTNATHFLGEDSPCFVHCFTHCNQSVACGSLHYGCHEVRVFDLVSGINKESYRGHSRKICSVAYDKSQESGNRIISGGEDKKLNLYDGSSKYPVSSLLGVSSPPVCLQFEDWKVVSGSRDGTVTVWDLRIGQELWTAHDRHSVSLCEIDKEYLIVAHIPSVRPVSASGSPLYSKQCGAVRVYDFSADLSDYTKSLPSICSSSYDEPSASFYNLNLLYPYDIIQ